MHNNFVFLSYLTENRSDVAQLRSDLMAAGLTVWWDQDILPGMDWKYQIRQAMSKSCAVVVCLSRELENRTQSGMFPEIHNAIAAYRQQAPGSLFLFPVRLSECQSPDIEIDDLRNLRSLQMLDLFPEANRKTAIDQLINALKLVKKK